MTQLLSHNHLLFTKIINRTKRFQVVVENLTSKLHSNLPPYQFEPTPFKTKLTPTQIEQIHKANLNPCLKTTFRKPLLIKQGYMQYVWDNNNRRYLDMFGGIVTTSVGHCHPKLVDTVSKQSKKLWHVSSLYLTEEIHEFAQKLAKRFPEPLKYLLFCNSGSEANDIAIIMSRLYTNAFDIVALGNAYHGCSLSTMPLCAIGVWKFPMPTSFGYHHVSTPDPFRGRFGGLYCRDSIVQTTRHCDCISQDHCKANFEYIKDLEMVLDSTLPKNIAAFFAESIQGVGGVVQYPKKYIKKVYDLVKQRGGLMVMDEVQTGFGRIGTNFWEFESHGIIPDIVTMAKGIGNGFPLAAVITTEKIAQTLTLGSYFNTFGGNPFAMAIGSTVLDIIDEDKLQENAQQLGKILLNELSKLREQYADIVGDVRGKGLMIGVEMMLNGNSMPTNHFEFIIEQCKDMGLILGRGGPHGNVFRITPPMCINEYDVQFTIETIKKAFDIYYNCRAKNEFN